MLYLVLKKLNVIVDNTNLKEYINSIIDTFKYSINYRVLTFLKISKLKG
jgi:hypothetical protein